MIDPAEMYLYHLTLQSPTAVTHAVVGYFTGAKQQELLVARGRELELYKLYDRNKLVSMGKRDVFGIIRSLRPFRLLNSGKDYIAIGSDSGKITILEFDKKSPQLFKPLHQETFGKSGIRRIVPGQYLAADPKGRALMIAAVEKQKFVYVMNRDSNNNLTISSPLEAHKSHSCCFDLCALDVNFENPVFASIEQIYDDRPTKKHVVFWEMDLGLNHVVKKCSLHVPDSAHMLIPVPGGGTGSEDGPSGVIVCCENYLIYKAPDKPEVVCALPRRFELAQDAKIMSVCFAVHQLRGLFFFLVQSDYGDIYKVELQFTREGDTVQVKEMVIRLLDSLPVSTVFAVFRSGFLFLASEAGDHQLFRFVGIADDETEAICTSSHPDGITAVVAFRPRPLKNLHPLATLTNLSPVLDMKVVDATGSGLPQLYLACGKGTRSTLRALQQGSTVGDLAENDIPGNPTAVWSIVDPETPPFHRYIFIRQSESTLILRVDESITEDPNTPFRSEVLTLHVAVIGAGLIVQVYETGIRFVRGFSDQQPTQWSTPPGRRITDRKSVV